MGPAGGDAFFVCQELFSTPKLIVTPSHTESPGAIEVCFFRGGIVSIRTRSVFDIRSVDKMDGRELVEIHATHVLNLLVRRSGLDACCLQRHLLIDSPDSGVVADMADLLGL